MTSPRDIGRYELRHRGRCRRSTAARRRACADLSAGPASTTLRNLGDVIVRPFVGHDALLEDALRSGGTLSLPLDSCRTEQRQECHQSATRTKRANQGFRAHRVNLLIYKRILVALPGLEPGLFALTGRTKNSRQRRLVRSGFAAKNAPAGQRQIRTHIGR